jgi:DNA recombination protein RmuC
MNQLVIYLLLSLILIGLIVVIKLLYSQKKEREEAAKTENTPLAQLNQNLQGLETRVDNKLNKVQSSYSALNKELGVVQEMSKQMKDLNSMIKSPKLRGNIGEKLMGNLLDDMLPKKSYQTQYQFSSGSTVDAIIKVQKEIIPIDSKFPIENFKKFQEAETKDEKIEYKRKFKNDVRKHIRDISQKYIRTEEGTVNFAVMYIPSEMVYQAISKNEEIWGYSNKLRVFMTSPNHFYYFLQTIIIGIERNKISKASLQILNNLKGIQRDLGDFGENLQVVNKHISNAKKQINQARNSFNDIKDKVDQSASWEASEIEELPDEEELPIKENQ